MVVSGKVIQASKDCWRVFAIEFIAWLQAEEVAVAYIDVAVI